MYECTECGNINNFIEENIVMTKIELSDNGKINNMRNISTDHLRVYCSECNCIIASSKE